jgi:hypothetical protein
VKQAAEQEALRHPDGCECWDCKPYYLPGDSPAFR